MEDTLEPTVRAYPSRERACRAAAEGIVALVAKTLERSEFFSLACSGGQTPRILYQLLAGQYVEKIPWARVQFFWGDERYVPKGDPHSNFRMVHETLLRHIQCLQQNLFPMPTNRSDPGEAARDYESLLRTQFTGAWPRFDLILLGMGMDGHTASLFPDSPALDEKRSWVVVAEAPTEPTTRLTLTLPVLNAGRHVYFLVSGEEKADVLRRTIVEPVDPRKRPAGAVRPPDGELVWWIDEAAAVKLDGARYRSYS